MHSSVAEARDITFDAIRFSALLDEETYRERLAIKLLDEDVTTYREQLARYLKKSFQRLREVLQVT